MNTDFYILYGLISFVCAVYAWFECHAKKQHWTYQLWWPFKVIAFVVVGLLWFPIMMKGFVTFLIGGLFGK